MTEPPASPVMVQYHEIKRANPGCLLFFRMGDFFELFFEDAVAAAQASQPSGRAAVLTQARLVYVAVVSGEVGFLEPAYLFTGTAGGAPAQVLVSALAPTALR